MVVDKYFWMEEAAELQWNVKQRTHAEKNFAARRHLIVHTSKQPQGKL